MLAEMTATASGLLSLARRFGGQFRSTSVKETMMDESSEIPPTTNVLFIEDLVRILRMSRATLDRRRKARAFPIPELPALDNRPRWSRASVELYLSGLKPKS